MSFFRNRKLRKVAEENGINFDGHMGLSINGKLVSEFGYLLRYYTDGNLDSFSDRSKLYAVKSQVIEAVDQDLAAEKTREEEALGISRATAEANLRNLKAIVTALSNYYEAEMA
ncbi:hypothetical protein [Ectothiorhodospira shaposhnikovii]|uniref:hypothetical protein n=1 Tax=Ectothiorhodospira shaposhnikovii TaxID=1054 RepID=UPI001EE94BD0|nr:hypothetical protein [Ectothiorhodospira shaposhnikovii]MCG5514448.1 hypothetical protein [Ectothiorhodospira shaposhnikovii]